MMRLFLFVMILLIPAQARADIFLWEDPKSGLTLSFPDTWNVVHNQMPDDVFTAAGPSDEADPVCRVRVSPDKRYVIFPPSLGSEIQKVAVSKPFWESYLAQYHSYNIGKMHDGAGLGRWFASYALASYNRHNGRVPQQRTGLMFASLYNDKVYVAECSALTEGYEEWQPVFQSIIKSIDFKKAYHEWPTGEYQNFLSGATRYFWAGSPEGTTGY